MGANAVGYGSIITAFEDLQMCMLVVDRHTYFHLANLDKPAHAQSRPTGTLSKLSAIIDWANPKSTVQGRQQVDSG